MVDIERFNAYGYEGGTMTPLSKAQRRVLEELLRGSPLYYSELIIKMYVAMNAYFKVRKDTFRVLLRDGYISQQSAHPAYYHITDKGREALEG